MSRLLFSAVAFVSLAACSTNDTAHVSPEAFHGTSLDRHAIGATEQTQYLQVSLNPSDSQLRLPEIAKIRAFLKTYTSEGHGPLFLSVPSSGPTESLAIRAAAEARDIAWETGVNYEQMVGQPYDATGLEAAPMILSFKTYEVVKPDCPALGTIDFTDNRSNSDLPSFGCAIRTNMAAMIAEPGDIFGNRVLDEGDIERRTGQLQSYREGVTTNAERGADESVAVSNAVN